MPYKEIFVAPELFMTYKGLKVYHTYKNDNLAESRSSYTFALSKEPLQDCIDNGLVFCVKDLKTDNRDMLNAHPPFLSVSEPAFRNASPAQRAEWQKEWDVWHDRGELAAIKAVIRRAVDMKLIGS